jgi:hypothetical protein
MDVSACRDDFKDIRLFPDRPDSYNWNWTGFFRELEPLDGHQVIACLGLISSTMNRSGTYCLLVDGQRVDIEGLGPCMSGDLSRGDASTLLVSSFDGCCRRYNTRLHWNGSGFEVVGSWLSCGNDPGKPISDDFEPPELLEYCGYRG